MPNFYDEFHGRGGLYVMAADGTRQPVDKLPEPKPEAEAEPVKAATTKPAATESTTSTTKVSTNA